MKKLILPFLLVTLALFTFGCKDTSPKGVCEHMMDIAKDKDDKEVTVDDCAKMMESVKKELGDEKWDEFAKCVVDASDEDSAEKCFSKMK